MDRHVSRIIDEMINTRLMKSKWLLDKYCPSSQQDSLSPILPRLCMDQAPTDKRPCKVGGILLPIQ